MSAPLLHLRSLPRWCGLLLVVTTLAIPLGLSIGGPPPAHADISDTSQCNAYYKCLYFRKGYGPLVVDDGDGGTTEVDPPLPSTTSWDLVPTDLPPEDEDYVASIGTFQIVKHSTTLSAGTPKCLSTSFVGSAFLANCENKLGQRWYIEPVGIPYEPVVTDSADDDFWNPYWNDQSDWSREAKEGTKFYIRPALDFFGIEPCLGKNIEDGELNPCHEISQDNLGDYQWNVYGGSEEGYNYHNGDDRENLTKFLLARALEHAAMRCSRDVYVDLCAARLYDENKQAYVTDWGPIRDAALSSPPMPVLVPLGCAVTTPEGGGGAQVIYNGGDEPISASLGASGTNGYSHSFSKTIAVSHSFEVGVKDTFKTTVTITASSTWGQTWSESQTVSQNVQWTVPPHRYATASLATTALNLAAEWSFLTPGGPTGFNNWTTDQITKLRVPFSTSLNSSAPETVLTVRNSWAPKDCGARDPSRLPAGQVVHVVNNSAPGQAPVVGDELSTDVDPGWFVLPADSSTPPNLRYQWYRQRSTSAPEPILNANLPTYRVTTDDVTDDEILDRVGPYHLLVGVTDVADANRFDSREYLSVATPATAMPDEGAHETTLSITVANPNADAGTETLIDISASVRSGVAPSGSVRLIDNGVVIVPDLALDGGGMVRAEVRLARGVHRLEAVYDGDGTASPAASSVAETTVVGATSGTALELDQADVAVGEAATATVTVTPSRSGGDVPTGRVQLYAGEHTLGDPVPVDAVGSASIPVSASLSVGPRQISAVYLGDDVYDPSTSQPVTQYVTAAPSKIVVRLPAKVTHRRGNVVFKAKVSRPSGPTPTGRVQFLVDGRPRGAAVVVNRAGLARLRATGFTLGQRRISARFIPQDPDQAAATSPVKRLEVRRHAVRMAVHLDSAQVKRSQRVKITGRVILKQGKAGARLGRPKVRIMLDGKRIGANRLAGDGTFHFRFKARRMSRGVHRITVVYPGNAVFSVAPRISPTVRVHRR